MPAKTQDSKSTHERIHAVALSCTDTPEQLREAIEKHITWLETLDNPRAKGLTLVAQQALKQADDNQHPWAEYCYLNAWLGMIKIGWV